MSKNEANLGFDHGKVSIGNHFALLYDDDEERLDLLAKYLNAGLNDNERILYLVDDNDTTPICSHMEKRGITLQNSNQIHLDTAEHGYCPDGHFSIEKMMKVLENYSDQALEDGFSSSRGTGEMSWAFRKLKDTKDLMTYEALLTELLYQSKYLAICQYDTRKFSGQTIMDVLRTHPYVISKSKLIRNPYYMQADKFLKQMTVHSL